MSSLIFNENAVNGNKANGNKANNIECSYIEKEVDMGFFDNFAEDGQHLQSGCPCKCTCDCNRCGLPFG
jgi:hypothetical protein